MVDVIVYVLVFTDAQMECNEAVSRELELHKERQSRKTSASSDS